MITIDSDNADIEKNIRLMERRITENDGYLDPSLYIKCENGELSVEKHDFHDSSKPLIALPSALLFPTQASNITVKGETFHMDPAPNAITPIQQEMAEIMLDLYNLTHKIRNHKLSCCWITYQDTPEALDDLLAARSINPEAHKMAQYLHHKSNMTEDEFLCSSYLKSRVIGHNEKKPDGTPDTEPQIQTQAQAQAQTQASDPVTKIMPIIDFMNHHMAGAPFNFNDTYDPKKLNRNFLSVADHRPILTSNQCFAFYNQMDCLDAFINYGFPDTDSNFVRSVPVTLHLPHNLTIEIRGDMGFRYGKIHKKLAGLRPFIPTTMVNEPDRLVISHMIIPLTSINAHAMRRVLRLFIANKLGRKLNAQQIWDATLQAEETILRANETFYRDLITKCDQALAQSPHDNWEMTRFIASTQLAKLYKYRFDEDMQNVMQNTATADDSPPPQSAGKAAI